jgi:hypothetical protein
MRDDSRKRIEEWIRRGAPETAGPELETAWTDLFAALPDLGPSAEFTGRVMRRVGEARRSSRDLSPRWRFALAAGLALCGLFALCLPAVLLAAPLPVGGLIAAVTALVKVAAAWGAQGLAVWRFLAGVAETASLVLATREAIAFLASFAMLSAAALRLLYELTLYDWRTAGAAPR